MLNASDASVRDKLLDTMADNLLFIRLARKVLLALTQAKCHDRKRIVFGLLRRACQVDSE